MADISQAAGVTHLIVYRHFDSKDELYETVLVRARDNLSAAVSAGGASGPFGPTPATVLSAARQDGDAFRVLWRHAAREPQFCHHAEATRDLLLRVARDALVPAVTPEHLAWAARATVSYVVEAVLVWIEDGDEHLDSRFVAATEAALRAGVRSWSKPARRGRAVRRNDGR
jgi:AcrR family transcriptional regulator